MISKPINTHLIVTFKTLGIYYEFNLNDRCLIETLRMLKKLESFEIDAAFRFDLRGRFFTSFENLQKLYIDLGQPVSI